MTAHDFNPAPKVLRPRTRGKAKSSVFKEMDIFLPSNNNINDSGGTILNIKSSVVGNDKKL